MALVTESTRKGMSSVTIWTTVRALDHPSTSVGVEHPHVGSARLADLGELTVGRRHAGERCRRT